MTDQEFAASVAERSARIPGVVAVTLGGSRAHGGHGPDSDWDFGLYYRGTLDPQDVAALGWPGRVFAPGEWGGGVMNGGAWLQVNGRRVDLHYRDLDDVEHWLAEARLGRFKVERLPDEAMRWAAPGRWLGPSSRPPMPAWPPRGPGC